MGNSQPVVGIGRPARAPRHLGVGWCFVAGRFRARHELADDHAERIQIPARGAVGPLGGYFAVRRQLARLRQQRGLEQAPHVLVRERDDDEPLLQLGVRAQRHALRSHFLERHGAVHWERRAKPMFRIGTTEPHPQRLGVHSEALRHCGQVLPPAWRRKVHRRFWFLPHPGQPQPHAGPRGEGRSIEQDYRQDRGALRVDARASCGQPRFQPHQLGALSVADVLHRPLALLGFEIFRLH
mmetsp:Transcript_85188/g.260361  ORF Transcript_85188/g.260361 Transcript_85188/m.260361 type:complete len:239 (+) Transcript_85188:585-1301(+)